MVNTIAEALQRITGRGDLELTGLLRELCADSTALRRFDVSEDLGRLIRSARQGQIKLAARDALENREQGSYSDEVMHLDTLADLFLRAFLEFRSEEVFAGDTIKQHKVVYEQNYGIRITYGPFRRLYPELSEMLSAVHDIRVRSPAGHPEDKKTGKPKKKISDHEVAHARQQLALAIDHILAVVRSNVPKTAPQTPKRA